MRRVLFSVRWRDYSVPSFCWSQGQSGELKIQNNWKYKSAIDANKQLISQQLSFVYVFISFFFLLFFCVALNDWNRNASRSGSQLGFWNSYYSNLPQALQEYWNCKTGWNVKACKQFKIIDVVVFFVLSMLAKVKINTRLFPSQSWYFKTWLWDYSYWDNGI